MFLLLVLASADGLDASLSAIFGLLSFVKKCEDIASTWIVSPSWLFYQCVLGQQQGIYVM